MNDHNPNPTVARRVARRKVRLFEGISRHDEDVDVAFERAYNKALDEADAGATLLHVSTVSAQKEGPSWWVVIEATYR